MKALRIAFSQFESKQRPKEQMQSTRDGYTLDY